MFNRKKMKKDFFLLLTAHNHLKTISFKVTITGGIQINQIYTVVCGI